MNIIGISAHFHDAAACIIKDGELIAAAQEERFTRIKHDASIPKFSVHYCLQKAKLDPNDIDYVAYYEDPFKKAERQIWMGLPDFPITFPGQINRIDPYRPEREIRNILGLTSPILFYDHHLSHAASAYFFSGYENSAIMIVDGVGEWDTLSLGLGEASKIKLKALARFPHSIGLLYSTITAYLGFDVNDGEYKVMGLAPYGSPVCLNKMEKLIKNSANDTFELDLDYFAFVKEKKMYSDRLEDLLEYPARQKDAELTKFHKDIAKSMQVLLEELVLEKAFYAHSRYPSENLCMAGGVALNCVATSAIRQKGPYKNIFVQPAASDAGACLGAAVLAYCDKAEKPFRNQKMNHVFYGPSYDNDFILSLFENSDIRFKNFGNRKPQLISLIAKELYHGKVVGLFHGRMEFGPRALGARSILADPRGERIRDKINMKIKKRENFRPFAPAVLEDCLKDYFEMDHRSPFMLETCQIKTEGRFPAITHVDNSARVQSVNPKHNPFFYSIIEKFYSMSGCPILLNTSFNLRGEPIVCTPLEAFLCFVRTEIDLLILEETAISREDLSPKILQWYRHSRPLIREGDNNAVYTFL